MKLWGALGAIRHGLEEGSPLKQDMGRSGEQGQLERRQNPIWKQEVWLPADHFTRGVAPHVAEFPGHSGR